MLERLHQLENNISELYSLKESYKLEDIKDDVTKQWALRYGLLESIQITIDISCHLVVHLNLGNAKSYSECIYLLQKFDYLDNTLSGNLKSMVGLRNILVHEYVNVDIDQLFSMLDHLDDFGNFSKAVAPYL